MITSPLLEYRQPWFLYSAELCGSKSDHHYLLWGNANIASLVSPVVLGLGESQKPLFSLFLFLVQMNCNSELSSNFFFFLDKIGRISYMITCVVFLNTILIGSYSVVLIAVWMCKMIPALVVVKVK